MGFLATSAADPALTNPHEHGLLYVILYNYTILYIYIKYPCIKPTTSAQPFIIAKCQDIFFDLTWRG